MTSACLPSNRDSAYYCEYATHCGANIISRPPEMGYFVQFGGPTKYWYLNDDELLELGRDADVWIFPSNRWDDVYATHNATMDQIKAVQNKQVYDNQGSGSNAWFEQRLAEYDVVGLDFCDIVGTANPNGPPHVRRWFRNIFTEPIGDLPVCNAPDEFSEPYVPRGAECELLTDADFLKEEAVALEEEGATPEEDAEVPDDEDTTEEIAEVPDQEDTTSEQGEEPEEAPEEEETVAAEKEGSEEGGETASAPAETTAAAAESSAGVLAVTATQMTLCLLGTWTLV